MASADKIVVEIVRVVAKKGFLADSRKAVSPTLSQVGKAEGHLKSYFGVGIQDPQAGFIANVWQSLELHEGLVSNKEKFDPILESFKGVSAELKYLLHAHFNAAPYTPLSAPTTEFALWTVKEGADLGVFTAKLDQLVKTALGWEKEKGCLGGGWGQVTENERQFFVLLGWTDLETFTKSVQDSERALQLIAELKELAELELIHAQLQQF